MLLGFSQFYTNINCHSNLKQPLMSIIWNRFVNMVVNAMNVMSHNVMQQTWTNFVNLKHDAIKLYDFM